MKEVATSTGAPPGVSVRITRVECVPLHLPLRTSFEIATGGKRTALEVLLVRLHTNAGPVGIGETQAWRRLGSSETLRGLVSAVDEVLAPCLVGRSPFEAPAIIAAIDTALDGSPYAKAAVLDALLDLQGRVLGVPASHLLGGYARDAVEICAVLPLAGNIEHTTDIARGLAERGFGSFVVKVAIGQANAELVRALRTALPDANLRLDANASLDWQSARVLADSIAECGIEGLEQPFAPWDVEGMAALAATTRVPLIADESVGTVQDLLRVVRLRAAHGFQTKVAKNGGAWNTRELWTVGARAGLRIYPGNHPSTSVAAASVAQLAAAWPGQLMPGPFAVGIVDQLVTDIVTTPLIVCGKYVQVPHGPGFGVELDEDLLRRYRVDR